MHTNGCSIAYSDVDAMTSPTTITELSSLTGNRSAWAMIDRKLVGADVKKIAGQRNPGVLTITRGYAKATHAALDVLHAAANAAAGKKFWQITYPDGGKSPSFQAVVAEFGPPDITHDGDLMTTFQLCITDADDVGFITV
jgi:hypothetical protein